MSDNAKCVLCNERDAMAGWHLCHSCNASERYHVERYVSQATQAELVREREKVQKLWKYINRCRIDSDGEIRPDMGEVKAKMVELWPELGE